METPPVIEPEVENDYRVLNDINLGAEELHNLPGSSGSYPLQEISNNVSSIRDQSDGSYALAPSDNSDSSTSDDDGVESENIHPSNMMTSPTHTAGGCGRP